MTHFQQSSHTFQIAKSLFLPTTIQHFRALFLLATFCAIAILLTSATALQAQDENGRLEPTSVELEATPCAPCNLRPQDQFWVISTRHLGCLGSDFTGMPDLEYLRYQDDELEKSSFHLFQATGKSIPNTVFYIHGNQIDSDLALERGEMVYQSLIEGRQDETPLRMVIWSWPSAKIPGLLRDVRVKADRSDDEAYYLGWLLSKTSADTKTCLIGYSFGARVSTGALHLLGGGELYAGGLNIDQPKDKVCVVLLAAALHTEWLLQGEYHDRASSQMERALILYNPADPVLTRYRFIERCSKPEALGFTGLCEVGLPNELLHLTQRNVICEIGRSHDVSRYFCSPQIVRELQDFTGFKDGVSEPTVASMNP